MNRREFTRGLAALGVAPALPLPALARGAPAAGAVAMSTAAEQMYFWGWFTARVHKTCSPDSLSRLLKLDPDVATEIFNRLLTDGAITPPDAFGVSRAVDPLYEKFTTMKGEVAKRVAHGDTASGDRPRRRLKSGDRVTDNEAEAPQTDDNSDPGPNDAKVAPDEPLPVVNQAESTMTNERDSADHTTGSDPDDTRRGA